MTAQIPDAPIGTNVWGDTVTIKYSDNKGVAYGDTDKITYTLDTIPSFTNAGTYYVYYEMIADDCEPTTGMITYTIDKMQLYWNNDGVVADKVYDGTTVATVTTEPTLMVILTIYQILQSVRRILKMPMYQIQTQVIQKQEQKLLQRST